MRPGENPFVGLRPFEAEDALYYFGRGDQTQALLNCLRETRFLAVVGSSGSGKSSLVRAGLIPNLEAGFMARNRDAWHIARMKPGDRPVDNLAQALRHALDPGDASTTGSQWYEAISTKGIHGALANIRPVLEGEKSNLFLLVDQFEEVFRYGVLSKETGKQEHAAEFVDLLLRLAEQEEVPVYVCLTMRSDYIGDCDVFPGLPEAMNRGQYLVPRLTRTQRREAIEGPIRLSGASISTRLLDRILNESGQIRDDLPVLQHALMRTWEKWQDDPSRGSFIDMGHYQEIGTMKNALSNHADEALAELPGEDRHLAKRLFQALTETDAENRAIRRPARLSQLEAVTNAPGDKLKLIIDKFRRHHRAFLVLSSDDDNPLADISHESLMRQWETLKKWMEEEAGHADTYRRLADAAELFQKKKGGPYTDPALQAALDWLKDRAPTRAWAEQYRQNFDRAITFLEKSREIRDEKKQQEERERLLIEKNRQQQKTLRLTKIFIVIISISLLISLFLVVQAVQRSREVKRLRLEANYNLAKAFEEKARKGLDSGDYKHAWLYMTAALKQEIPGDRLHLQPDLAGALLNREAVNKAFCERWFSSTSHSHSTPVTSVAFSPDGKTLASGSVDKTIRLWDLGTQKETSTLKGHSDPVTAVAFSPDGKILASGSDDNTIRLWNLETQKETAILTGHSDYVTDVAFSPDGKTLASGSNDNTIRLWNLGIQKEKATLEGHLSSVTSVAFSPDGKTLASGSRDNTIRLWNLGTQKETATLKGHSDPVISVAFSPDGKILASGSVDNTIRLWNLGIQKEKATLEGHLSSPTSVAFSPDGKTLASGSIDNTIRLWDLGPQKETAALTGHSDSVTAVAFSPDGKTLASGSGDKTIRLWDLGTQKETATLTGHSYSVTAVAFSPGGKTLASGSRDNTIRLWDLGTQKETATLKGHSDVVTSVAFSPDGKILASGSLDKTIRLWDLGTQKETATLTGHSDYVTAVAFSPDGKILAFGSVDKTIRLWDLGTQKETATLTGHSLSVASVAFSPDGKTLASGSYDNTIRLWDLGTQKETATLTGHSSVVTSVAFSPDGKTLASGSVDNTIRLWDLGPQKETATLTGHSSSVTAVAFSPDGKTLASGSADNTIRLWDLRIYFDLLNAGKPTPLFFTFTEGVEFFWGVKLEGFEYKKVDERSKDKKFLPLLAAPAKGQSKFDQILEWAKKQQ